MSLSGQRVSPVETRTESNQFYAKEGTNCPFGASSSLTFAKIPEFSSAIIDCTGRIYQLGFVCFIVKNQKFLTNSILHYINANAFILFRNTNLAT